MVGAAKLRALAHGDLRGRRFHDRGSTAGIAERIVEAEAVWDLAQELDRLARRCALVEHHADDEDADEARLPGLLIDHMQADAQPVLVHAVDAARETIGEADAGVHTLGL